MMFWVLLAAIALLLWAVTRFYLAGPDLSEFDGHAATRIGDDLEPSAEHHEVLQLLHEMSSAGEEASRRNRLTAMRVAMARTSAGVKAGWPIGVTPILIPLRFHVGRQNRPFRQSYQRQVTKTLMRETQAYLTHTRRRSKRSAPRQPRGRWPFTAGPAFSPAARPPRTGSADRCARRTKSWQRPHRT